MKFHRILAFVTVFMLGLATGCGDPSSGPGDSGDDPEAGEWLLTVDLDHAGLTIDSGLSASFVTQISGHTVEVKNGPAGCSWNVGTSTLTCEIMFRNLSSMCMSGVRTLYHDSTNPSAIMTGADYIWPGPTVIPNSAQPINNSGYCITQSGPSSAGSSEGCQNTWQADISPGGIATQNFVFTNVPSGQYTVYLSVYASFSACSVPVGMARVPAGCFSMGDAFGEGAANELPVHNVCITSDFAMDAREVTNTDFAACVTAGSCLAPSNFSSATRASYYGNPTYANFPVIYVNWSQATAYCAWAGKRLPTEAEWEYAARGGLAGSRHPWGNAISGANANYFNSGDAWDNDTSPVGNYAANGYGLFDMSGNILEWVNDWYLANYYGSSPTNDPPGPAPNSDRVLRGGEWGYYGIGEYGMRVSYRLMGPPSAQGNFVGFRCVMD